MPEEKSKKIDLSKLKSMDVKDLKGLFAKKQKKNGKKRKVEKPKNAIAIDIGSNCIKMAEGKYTRNSLRVNNLMQIPTPEGAISDGKIVNSEAIKEVIKYAFSAYNFRAKNGIVTTNSSSIINREVIIPKVDEEEMDTVTRYEIQQYLPINLDDYIVEFIVLNEIQEESGAKLRLNVITYPERAAFGYYELIDSLDVNPYALDVTYNSLRKIAEHSGLITQEKNEENMEGTVAFIDMGATSVNITVFKGTNVDFTRIIKFGGNNINLALNEKLNMSIKATESQKREKGNLTDVDESDEFNVVIRDTVDEFIDELQRVLQFYITKSSAKSIDRLYVYGGCSNLRGMDTYMGEKLNMNVEKIFALDNVDINNRKVVDEPVGEYLNVIGSLIRL